MQSSAKATSVILAGGLGTRLRPVVAHQPKVLAQIGGRPFLEHLFDQLAAVGIRYVVLCIGYLGEQVRAMFGDTYGPLRLTYSQESSPLGTGGALRLALPLVKSESVLVMNGDSFCETDLRAFWTWHVMRGAAATLLLTEMIDGKRYGRVKIGPDGMVLRFDEKGDEGKSEPIWINAGVYAIARSLIATVPINQNVSLEREMFPAWVGRGLYGYRSKGRFIDIGTPKAYARAKQFFAREIPS